MPRKGQFAPATNMGYFSKLKMTLFSPSTLFDSVKTETGYGAPLKFLLITTLLTGVIFGVVLLALMSILAPLLAMIPVIGQMLGMFLFFAGPMLIAIIIVFLLIAMLIGSFVGAAILHVFAKLLKGVGTYQETYKATCYSTAPLLFAWIPIIGFVAVVWELAILTVGISKLHVMSTGRAVLVWLIPVIIVAVIFVMLLPTMLFTGGFQAVGGPAGFEIPSGPTIIGECALKPETGEWCYTTTGPFAGETCSSDADGCLFIRAQETQNVTDCDIITDSDMRANCHQIVGGV